MPTPTKNGTEASGSAAAPAAAPVVDAPSDAKEADAREATGSTAASDATDAKDAKDAKVRKPKAPEAGKQPVTVLFDRVMVQISPSDGERRSRAGILIPATAQITRRLAWAEAVAVGPHVRTVKVGDTVLFNPEDRFEVEVQGEEYVILRERDIHAIASTRNDSGTGLYL